MSKVYNHLTRLQWNAKFYFTGPLSAQTSSRWARHSAGIN